jgi:hypothetical protein
MPIPHLDLPAPLGPPARGPGAPQMPPGHEIDTLAGRLRWSGAFAGLLLVDAGIMYGAARLLAATSDPLAVVWFGGALLCGLYVSTGMVAHRLYLAWKQERHTVYAWQDYIDVTIDRDGEYWDVLLDTQSAYTQYHYRTAKKRQVTEIDGRLIDLDTGEILAPDGRWYASGAQPAPAGDDSSAGGGIVAALRDKFTTGRAEQKTQPLGLPPAPPALSAPAARFLAAILHGQAYGMRRLVPSEMTRPQYDVVVAALLAGNVLYKDKGNTFRLAPQVEQWRQAYSDTTGMPPDDQMARRQEIERLATYWVRARIAGIDPGEPARLAS